MKYWTGLKKNHYKIITMEKQKKWRKLSGES